ncbi:MAG: glycosyltransferase family 2 protein [Anaerolineae bacterium]|nr:glycosyltransferase family 2 protein [Anaerolineae bacterium]
MAICNRPIDLSVIIVSWNTCQLLRACLESLAREIEVLREHRLTAEVWVVDNASSDGTVQMIQSGFSWAQLMANEINAGFAAANNQAIQSSRGRYVALLNPDTVVVAGAFTEMLAFMDETEEAAACGPLLLNGDGSLQPSCHPVLTPSREAWRLFFLDRLVPRATYPMHRWKQTESRQVEVIKGACLVVRREALDQVGLFDEQYFMYAEETDLCHRLSSAGWQLFWVPDARVIHYGGQSTRQVPVEMIVALYRSKVQFVRKFSAEWGARRLKAVLLAAFLPRWVVATLGQVLDPKLAARARSYRALLAQLPGM